MKGYFIRYVFIHIFMLLLIENKANKTENSLKNIWKVEEWGIMPKDPTDFTTIMFYKYANKKEGLTLQAFENLHNCLLKATDCNESLSSEDHPFVYLSDCKINSAISPDWCNALHSCLRGKELTSLLPSLNSSADIITLDHLKILMPVIFYQIQSDFCNGKEIELVSDINKPTNVEVWCYGFLFVSLISALSLIGVSVLPLMAEAFYQKLLTSLIGLAVGSLVASSVFHLIPQSYKLADIDEHHNYLFQSLVILFGIWLFFMIERILKIIFTIQKRQKKMMSNSTSQQTIIKHTGEEAKICKFCRTAEHHCECSSSGGGSVSCDEMKAVLNDKITIDCGDGKNDVTNEVALPQTNNIELIYASQEQAIKASFGFEEKPEVDHHSHDVHFRQGKDSVIATVAWMIIFGDGFHNFIDGISIGAAFQQSILTGISISLAVMCEELPHELGDFAVLLNSGMTMRQALFYNFLSATTCYIGLICGIVLGEFTQDSTYIFALAAGMFLYISLVDMLPEMNETASKAAEDNITEVFQVLLLQNIGLFIGVFSLFFLAYYQDSITLV